RRVGLGDLALDEAGDVGDLLRRRPRLLVLRGHVAIAELAAAPLPAVGAVGQGLERVIGLQVQVALLLPLAVAGGAVLHYERLHQALEGVGGRRRCARGRGLGWRTGPGRRRRRGRDRVRRL